MYPHYCECVSIVLQATKGTSAHCRGYLIIIILLGTKKTWIGNTSTPTAAKDKLKQATSTSKIKSFSTLVFNCLVILLYLHPCNTNFFHDIFLKVIFNDDNDRYLACEISLLSNYDDFTTRKIN
jgi:hypothetical protein